MSQPKLSIVIPVLNDQEEINATVYSIRETSLASEVEIIVIDDQSDQPATLGDPQTILCRNNNRIGVGGCRHLGATMATAPYLLFIDAHMRFEPGWYEKAIGRIWDRPATLHNAACLGLDETCMDITKHKGAYLGADLVLEDRQGRIFEGVWASDKGGDDYELSCIMGANYFIPRQFFLHIGGLSALKMWGSDEPFLALKTWLCGGEVRLMREVRIGHKFRNQASYATQIHYMPYNKLRTMKITLPDDLYQYLSQRLVRTAGYDQAMERMKLDAEEIEQERRETQAKYTRDLDWLCEKFKILHPLKTPVHNLPRITDIYNTRRVMSSDINEHMEMLAKLSALCMHVTEFGVRTGNSTAALIHGGPSRLISYDINAFKDAELFRQAAQGKGTNFEFRQADVRQIPTIESTQMLFIDTLHTGAQLGMELHRHARQVSKFIVLHDTSTFGDTGEDGTAGLWPAVATWLRKNPEWHVMQIFTHNNGLTILEKRA